MAKGEGGVARPLRQSEYVLRFASREAEKGWIDLVATALNAAVAAWEFLTRTPTAEDGRDCYRLAGRMARVTIGGARTRPLAVQADQRWTYLVRRHSPTEEGGEVSCSWSV